MPDEPEVDSLSSVPPEEPSPEAAELAGPKGEEASPKQDIESLRSDVLATQAELNRLREEAKRDRQSAKDFRDSVNQRIRERYAREKAVIDQYEREGVRTKDEAILDRARLKDRIEEEENAPESGRASALAPEATSPEYVANAAYFRGKAEAILEASHLVETDPEYAELPKNVPQGYSPQQAVEWWRKEVEKQTKAKDARLAAEKKEKLERARQSIPLVEASSGGSVPASLTAGDAEKELQKMLQKGPPGDPAGINEWRNRIAILKKKAGWG